MDHVDSIVWQDKIYSRKDQKALEVQETNPAIQKDLIKHLGDDHYVIAAPNISIFCPGDDYPAHVPDLYVIPKNFTDWCVIEVERPAHTPTHIKSQIHVFTHGIYNDDVLLQNLKDKIIEMDSDVNQDLITNALKSLPQPKVLLLFDSDQGASKHIENLESYLDLKIAYWLRYEGINTPHRSFRRYDGWLPLFPTQSKLAVAHKSNNHERFNLKKCSSLLTRFNHRDGISLLHGGHETKWMLYQTENKWILIPMDAQASELVSKTKHKVNFIINDYQSHLALERV